MTATDSPPVRDAALSPAPPQRLHRLHRLGAVRPSPQPARVLSVAAVTALAVATVVRFLAPRDLWLDEALSVEIARLPVPDLLTALRHDGSPPLYYLLLHGWMGLFGRSPGAVRALSGVVSLAALPAMAALGARVLGRRPGALAALLLLAGAPFAVRFASETRMYGLLVVEVCLGGLALLRAAERPTLARLGQLSLAALALALTHYWALFLLAALGLGLLAQRRWRLLAALAAAGVLFAPQLPTLVEQLRHTGTPWALSPQPRAVLDTLLAWGGPGGHWAALPLAFALLGLAALGAFARRHDEVLVLGWRSDAVGRALLGLSVGPLALAVTAAMLAGSGYVTRYTAVALPAYLLLVARGVGRLPRRASAVTLALLVGAGLLVGAADARTPRTQAATVARVVAAVSSPGDLVVYCPDQVAPAVHRLLPPGWREVSYGDPLGPARVDWVDYAERNSRLRPRQLAETYDAQAGAHARVVVVGAEGYRTLEGQCSALVTALARLRPDAHRVLAREASSGDGASVVVFTAPAAAAAGAVRGAPGAPAVPPLLG